VEEFHDDAAADEADDDSEPGFAEVFHVVFVGWEAQVFNLLNYL